MPACTNDAVGRLGLTTEDSGTSDAADDLLRDYCCDGLNGRWWVNDRP